MSRHERLFLNDMVEACRKLVACIEGYDRSALEAAWIRYDAVLRNLTVLGEAAKGISEETRSRYPAVPWRKIAGMRDIVSHHYFGIDRDAIWDAARNRVPQLLDELSRIQEEAEGAQ